jgi:hypothetical protein
VANREIMTRGGAFSCAGVCEGDRTNWSSEPCDRCEPLDACEASEELDAVRWYVGRLGVGNGNRKE